MAWLYCSICARNVGEAGWEIHLTSFKHTRLAKEQNMLPHMKPSLPPAQDLQRFCEPCRENVKSSFWTRHISTKKHQDQERYHQLRAKMQEAERDKNGLYIGGCLDIGIVDASQGERGISREVVVKAVDDKVTAMLIHAYFVSFRAGRSYRSGFSVLAADFDQPILPGHPAVIEYTFQKYHIGRYSDEIELLFEDTKSKAKFVIRRRLSAIIGDKHEHETLKPRAPYVSPVKVGRDPEMHVVPGIAPPALAAVRYVVTLPLAAIPQYISAILDQDKPLRQKLAQIQKFHPAKFNVGTYTTHFKNLLWYEEQKTESDLARYDMSGVTLSRYNNYYYLAIPGLAEKRPSVLVGDRILVQQTGCQPGHWFEGHVHVVRQAEVGLRFHGSFSGWDANKLYNIRFKLNRIILRRQHQAVDSSFNEERILFPAPRHLLPIGTTGRDKTIRVFNTLISDNPRQMEAVTAIAYQPPGSTPFILFGPPGTGKTITMVEAIRRVLRLHPSSRILACAPSNSAADLIAERLLTSLTPNEMFRMYAVSRSPSDVSYKLRDYTSSTREGHFTVPPMARLKSFRVIVATCMASSMAVGIGMPLGHFTHIFVDEAGHATESETLIPVKTMAGSQTNVVLSGDPKQLGPIVRSGIARQYGFEQSFLERLMKRPCYDIEKYHGLSVVKLLKNFRCHDAILKYPNEKFYAGELVPSAAYSLIDTYAGSPLLPRSKFPVVFHSVSGKDEREASSPSFFNIDEVLQVKAYVQKLKADRNIRTTDHDIGIIAPYHAQCLKLRTALRSVAESVKVGSVEEFQGQERKVIIISTVRSSKEFLEYDLHHTLGFVANPRRFNVAVTRAQALLIVVGDPHVLGLDPLWRSFLNYIDTHGGWVGPEIPWDSSVPVGDVARYDVAVRKAAEMDMNEFARRVERMTLDQVEDLDANVDRPWRDAE
ncbi:RNA helicase [Coprinopsis sp. MPI-PUGE-AT-0042]|nr:RNA helicase [Coprinopsis sp. MPI-PUGE-AT-0042]